MKPVADNSRQKSVILRTFNHATTPKSDISSKFITQALHFKDIFKCQILLYAFGNSFDIITQPLQKFMISAMRYFLHRIIYSGIFSKVTFYHMLLTIHLISSPNNSKSPKYRRLDIFCTL